MEAAGQFSKLFSPGQIGKLELKNRVCFPPFDTNYASVDGMATLRYVDYIEERAKGGAGLLVAASAYVSSYGRGGYCELGICSDDLIPGVRRLADACHRHGAAFGMHLVHVGRQNTADISGVQPAGPSNVPCNSGDGEMVREMSIAEIQDLIGEFADAALRTKKAGCDLVQIHGAHGYLINAFTSPFSNKRTDKYGGSFENRIRFPLEILDAVRQTVGPDFPIMYRLSGSEKIEGGLTAEDQRELARALERAGIDAIDISAGINETATWIFQPMDFPAGCLVHLAEVIKPALKVPVLIAGRIFHPVLAEKILADGRADFINIGRGLHADPYWPTKAQKGRLDEITHCLGCNQGCTDYLTQGKPITCMVNPAAGRERELAIKPARERKRVMVVGGGPAGMMAASVAGQRGHEVTLYEKEPSLGGQMRLAAIPPYKGMYHWIPRDLEVQMAKVGVRVVLDAEVTPELVHQINPDVLVVATGARPAKLRIKGADKRHVLLGTDVLEGRVEPGQNVVIYRGKREGCQLAEFLAADGREVIVVEPTAKLMSDAGFTIANTYLDRVAHNPRIHFRTRTTLEEIKDRSIITQTAGEIEEIKGIDSVVFSWATSPNNELAERLQVEGRVPEIYITGDCRFPRDAVEAVREGYEVGLRI